MLSKKGSRARPDRRQALPVEIPDNYSFNSLAQATLMTQAWLWVYNNERPHSSLEYMTRGGSC